MLCAESRSDAMSLFSLSLLLSCQRVSAANISRGRIGLAVKSTRVLASDTNLTLPDKEQAFRKVVTSGMLAAIHFAEMPHYDRL